VKVQSCDINCSDQLAGSFYSNIHLGEILRLADMNKLLNGRTNDCCSIT